MHRYLITGATGFVGGHVAEALSARGEPTVTLARSSSDTTLLQKLGTQIVLGDLGNADIPEEALNDVDVVIHCAAKVGDWGPVEEYRAVNVEGLRRLLEACKEKKLHRFILVSSLGVYAARHHYQTDETAPLPEKHVDGYTQSKVEAEKVAMEYYQKEGIPVVILRPGFIYGPRDRTVLPTIVQNLKRKVVRYVSGGKYAVNTTYVTNLVDAILLAIDNPKAIGQIYNITDGEFVSKRTFFSTVADGLGLPHPGMGGPLFGAKILAKMVEGYARMRGWKQAPRLTMARLKFLGMNLDFSIAKARTELGYQPKIGFAEGMGQAMAWYKATYPHEVPDAKI